jgi:hypothetical protein
MLFVGLEFEKSPMPVKLSLCCLAGQVVQQNGVLQSVVELFWSLVNGIAFLCVLLPTLHFMHQQLVP